MGRVSVFRPSVRVTAPDRREWEIYAYRIKLPHRGALDPLVSDDVGDPRAAALAFPFLVGSALLRGLVRLLVDIPVAGIRALRSDEWTIEAISWAPYRIGYAWTTTSEHRGQVLAQVEGGIARGDRPRPRNAQLVRAT
jgi:hypothetical protein